MGRRLEGFSFSRADAGVADTDGAAAGRGAGDTDAAPTIAAEGKRGTYTQLSHGGDHGEQHCLGRRPAALLR